jgi:phospholipase C
MKAASQLTTNGGHFMRSIRNSVLSCAALFGAAACGGAEASDKVVADNASEALSTDDTASHAVTNPDAQTRTPIKHVIVIVGENRTFDHVFATYQPKHDQRIWNLLSKHIINADGSPGPNYAEARQKSANAPAEDGYQLSPRDKQAYTTLPTPLVSGPQTPLFTSLEDAKAAEASLPDDYYQYLLSGATGLATGQPDTRTPNVSALPPGPFQLTPAIPYDAYTGDPVHRFYQMWQQLDCSAAQANWENPSGCQNDLFAWVEQTVSTGSNGQPAASPFVDREGARSLGFYNIAQGDAPYFKYLADSFAMSDNFHQSIQGGTGANHVALGTGDAVWFSDGKGAALTPPSLNTENPDPQSGSNNYYTQDGYSGGTYSQCADASAPGAKSVRGYLDALKVDPNCEDGHYYLLNNYSPGYLSDGTVNNDQFAVPPSSLRNIGDSLMERGISWRYYGDSFNRNVVDAAGTDPLDDYCDICNPFQYATSIMADAEVRTEHLKDTADLYSDIEMGWLPAFSIVKPAGLVDGHPASSKLNLFEGFSKRIIDAVQAHPELWKDTAIFVTFDEGGGYYDSGYVQPLDFFGDGTRIPMIAVSPWSDGGHISHHYSDHVSILKFVERNWRLAPITERSRDNLPNPRATWQNPWVPRNGPAIDDLFDLFHFDRLQAHEETAGSGG